MSTVAYKATKISTILRAYIPVAIRATKNMEDTIFIIISFFKVDFYIALYNYKKPINVRIPRKLYASHQLSELTT